MKNLAIFWGLAGNYCLNMALSFRIFSFKNLGDFGGSCYESHLDWFLLPSGKNSAKIQKAVNIESQDESQRLETSLAA